MHIVSMFWDFDGNFMTQWPIPQVLVPEECSGVVGGSAPLLPTWSSPPVDFCGRSRNEEPSVRASSNIHRIL